MAASLKVFTAFWAHKTGAGVQDTTFLVLVKPYGAPTGWRRNEGRREEEIPWQQGGVVRWKDGHFSAEIEDIEAIPLSPTAAPRRR
jgi:hypothetical protein